MARAPGIILMCAAVIVSDPARAHDSPEHEIESLTSLMAASGKTPALLARRATEWRALGKLDRARADLADALKLQTNSAALWADFARVSASIGETASALDAANSALTLSEAPSDRAAMLLLRAEIHEQAGCNDRALADCDAAFREAPATPDCYLVRARLQKRSGRLAEAAAGLKEGLDRTGSVVLEIEWIEALIDAGRHHEALAMIRPRLERARWRAGWSIRHARAELGLGRSAEASQRLQAALEELDRRIRTDSPDPMLVTERALANALLGRRDAAERDIKYIYKSLPRSLTLHRLEAALTPPGKPSPSR